MLKKDPNYRRLKLGGRGTFSGTSSYWLGPDHLLVVEVANYVERYRRFYFRDVQAIIVQRSNVRLILNVVGCVVMVLILVIVLLVANSGSGMDASGGLIALGFLLFLPGLLLLVNNLSGPTCTVHVRTAVQTQKLNNISRLKKADLLVTELAPHLQAAQSATAAAESAPAAVTETFTESLPENAAPVEPPADTPSPAA